MSYRDVYEKWLSSSALSEAEKEELRSISGDEKEIESRFFAPLEFGTAGLRGTMCVGLHQMNIHVIRHATQAFAEVILAEGPEAVKRGVRCASTAATTPRSSPGRPPASWRATAFPCASSSPCAPRPSSPLPSGSTTASPA